MLSSYDFPEIRKRREMRREETGERRMSIPSKQSLFLPSRSQVGWIKQEEMAYMPGLTSFKSTEASSYFFSIYIIHIKVMKLKKYLCKLPPPVDCHM
jgi:hypothetical protein